jgi:hypothetical protein
MDLEFGHMNNYGSTRISDYYCRQQPIPAGAMIAAD